MIINLKQSRLPRKTNLILAASINSSTASLMPKIIYKYKSCLTSYRLALQPIFVCAENAQTRVYFVQDFSCRDFLEFSVLG